MTDTVPKSKLAMPSGIEVLRPSDINAIRIPWDARYTRSEIEEFAAQEPGLSLWSPRTGGYLLGGQWRHRTEIANVIDINGPSVAVDLLRAFVYRSAELNFELAIVAEYSERRRESYYAAAGLEPIEDIIVYELGRLPDATEAIAQRPDVNIEVVNVYDPQQRSQLLRLDHRAFPWLWWNTAGEFENYAAVPGVEIVMVRLDGGPPVGYIGTTSLGSWGHLDRIAVDPDFQGQGFGRWLLDLSIERLKSNGARRVALSTQASNVVSRALYESVGFRRSRAHDYRIYGRRVGSGDAHNDEKSEL